MKKAKWIILVSSIALCVCMALGLAALRDKNITVGHCVITGTGSYMLVDGDTPIRLSTRSGSNDLFEGLQDGDKILVIHGMVAESYPAQTIATHCIKLGSGSLDDISLSARNALSGMGWLGSGEELLTNAQTVTQTFDGVTVSLSIPQNWQWEIPQDGRRGIQFRPQGQEGDLGVYYYENGFFVCGTGLRQQAITLHSGLEGSMGTYNSSSVFDFISLREHDFAVINDGADDWWDSYGAEAMAIINSITIS